MLRRTVKRLRTGRYEVRLSSEERDFLRDLPNQLKALLAQADNPALRRLFPPAYTDDQAKEAEYRRLVGEDLLASRQAALDTMAATVDAAELDEGQVAAWLSSLNDLRLVIGTQLDVSEDENFPDTPLHHIYGYLTALEGEVIDAMAAQFD
ncbi:MAG: DUF2017 family protein [Acidimicrobiales bacterium]